MPHTAKIATPPATQTRELHNFPLLTDKVLISAAEEYVVLQATASHTEARLKTIKAQLVAALDGVPTAIVGKRIVSINDVLPLPPTENVVITLDMVGQVIPGSRGRAGYKTLSVR